MKRILLFLLLFTAALALARDKPETWIEVRSQHFVVATNSSEKQGRRIADQFERMRSVFHLRFPNLQIDPPSPVIVLAVNNEKDFRALEPASYLAKGQLKLGGLFLRAPDKNYVLMRLDAEGDHPYAVIYHEYTHMLLGKSAEWLPLWLNEGLAEFYQNSDIREKEVVLGQPSAENLAILREHKLLPLATLLAVDQKSPYYHEENKGSIFYAESWVLTHYLQIKDSQEKTHRLTDYAELLAKNLDPVEAAKGTLGDLQQLEVALGRYVQQATFYGFRMPVTTEVDDSAFKAQPLTPVAVDALRADFLANNDRTADARPLLDHVLREDANNVSAHETMGSLEFRQGHLDDAKKWYAQAVQLDSQSYLAHYYFAAIAMNGPVVAAEDPQVESSLRKAIQLNPSFAPTYDRLAAFLGMRGRDLNEARTMGVTAVSLDPGNITYRANVANILIAMQRGKDAVAVLRNAVKLAKSPEEAAMVDNFLMHAQEYQAEQERVAEQNRQYEEAGKTGSQTGVVTSSAAQPHLAQRGEFVPKGPHRFLAGVLKNVHCDAPGMDLTVASSGKTVALRSDNYYKIAFTSLNFQPSGDLNPCTGLEGRPAKVEYVESAKEGDAARLIGIELHK